MITTFPTNHRYVNWQAPFYKESIGKLKIKDIPLNARVTLIRSSEENESLEKRCQVSYKDELGWVPEKFLEIYMENYPKDCVDMEGLETPDKEDAEQFALYNKVKQTNLCGELSVCYILDVGLKSFLSHWEIKDPPFWKRIFSSGKGRGTGNVELQEMFEMFDVNSKTLNQQKWTPTLLKTLIENGDVICSVSIDGSSGRLRGSGILHWVVPVSITLERQGYGLVNLYNPYSNRIEVYSWNEFQSSARMPYGVFVPN